MKKTLTIILLSLIMVIPAMAQQSREGDRPRFDPDKFKARMESYIREKANLSQEESTKLFPVYFEMKSAQMNLYNQMHNLKKEQSAHPEKNNACKTVAQITELKVKLAEVEQTYYARMCKIVGGEKVLRVMNAEDTFHRDMLKMANGNHPGDNRQPRK